MIALSLNNITLVLGSRTLFSGLTWTIGEDHKIGPIGPNGAGKSSLFKVITGEYAPEPGGTVVRAKGVRVGYLAQEPVLDPGLTALDAALGGGERMGRVKSELAAVEGRMGSPEVYGNEKFAKRAKAIQNRLDKMDRLERPVLERRRMDLRLHGWRGSHKVLELRGVSKAFGKKVILQEAALVLHHGERVGVIGRNGTGKSVLLRLAQGSEQADRGEVIIGSEHQMRGVRAGARDAQPGANGA